MKMAIKKELTVAIKMAVVVRFRGVQKPSKRKPARNRPTQLPSPIATVSQLAAECDKPDASAQAGRNAKGM